MSFPTFAATNTSTDDDGDGTVVVNLPASISSGDLLLVFGMQNAGSDAWTTPSGWTQLYNTTTGLGRSVCYYKSASGSEGGTLSITSAVTFATSHVSMRITSGTYTGNPVAGTAAGGSGTTPNPPSLTSGFGAVDTTWIAVEWDNGSGTMVVPSSYGSKLAAGDGDGRFARMGTARRELNASSEDPGTFTVGSASWGAQTVAVQGVTAAGGQPTWKRFGGVEGMGGMRISGGGKVWMPDRRLWVPDHFRKAA